MTGEGAVLSQSCEVGKLRAMFRKMVAVVLAMLVLVDPPAVAAGNPYSRAALIIADAWSPPAPPGAPTAAGYLTIRNLGKRADRLRGGSSPAAARVDIHEMSMRDGIMDMRPLSEGLEIPPGGSVRLAPAGIHLMLIGLIRTFRPGERIPVSLRFARAGRLHLELNVQEEAPATGELGRAKVH